MKPTVMVVDGVDYSGKSTLVSKIKSTMEDHGLDVATVNFPTQYGKGGDARQALLNEETDLAADLMIANMVEVQDELETLDGPDLIIFDRHVVSTAANQGEHLAKEAAEKHGLFNHPLKIDLYYTLTIPHGVALERAKGRDVSWDDEVTEGHLATEESWVNLNQSYISGAAMASKEMAETDFKHVRCDSDRQSELTLQGICNDIASKRVTENV